jgi:bifunctional DNase/RNase
MKDILTFENLKNQIVFSTESKEEESFHQKDLIQLFPFGLSMTTDAMRPFLLLKDETQEHTLPVAVSPIEAGVAISQSNKAMLQGSPHRFTGELMLSLGLEIKQCVFVEIKGSHQYVRLYLSGHPKMNSMKLRADEAMSLCLHLGTSIFATKGFIARSRVMMTEAEQSAQNMSLMAAVHDKRGLYLN